MQCLYQNKQTIYYATYSGSTTAYDADYNVSGENVTHLQPTAIDMHVSFSKGSIDSSRGRAHLNEYGIDTAYVVTLVTDDMNCPIDETSVLWINRDPTEAYNFVVVRRIPSLSNIAYVCKQVDVS